MNESINRSFSLDDDDEADADDYYYYGAAAASVVSCRSFLSPLVGSWIYMPSYPIGPNPIQSSPIQSSPIHPLQSE